MLHVTLYKYVNKPIIVDKTAYLGTGLAMEGNALSGNQDMEYPVILLHFSAEPDYNYAYIQEYHRWYYVNNKTWVGGDVWSLNFSVDELYTYRALVLNIDGLVAYSNSGSSLKPDDRLVYNNPPTYVTTAPASTLKNPGESYILMRCRFFNTVSNMPTPDNNMVYIIFPINSYRVFQMNYTTLANGTEHEQALAVAIGKLIIDVTVLKWFDPTQYTPVTAGVLRFESPEIDNLESLGGYNMSLQYLDSGTLKNAEYYYFYDNAPEYKGVDLSWLLVYQYYWQRKAVRSIYVPYVGKITIDLERLGLSQSLSSFVGVHIDYDFSSNSYVLVPGVSTIAHGAESLETLYYGYAEKVSNMFSSAFSADTSLTLWETALDRQYTSGMLNIVAGIPAAAGNFLRGGIITPLAQNKMLQNDINYSKTEMAYAQAGSLTVRGTDNGGSIDTAFVKIINNQEVRLDAFMEVLISVPSTNFQDFWDTHGLPDGAHRNLADLTGYVQMQEFEMKYDSNATIGEMSRLEAQLYKGVIL